MANIRSPSASRNARAMTTASSRTVCSSSLGTFDVGVVRRRRTRGPGTVVTKPLPPQAGQASRFAALLFMAFSWVGATSPPAGLALELVRQLLQLPPARAKHLHELANHRCRRA